MDLSANNLATLGVMPFKVNVRVPVAVSGLQEQLLQHLLQLRVRTVVQVAVLGEVGPPAPNGLKTRRTLVN